jgi:penicillin amidase
MKSDRLLGTPRLAGATRRPRHNARQVKKKRNLQHMHLLDLSVTETDVEAPCCTVPAKVQRALKYCFWSLFVSWNCFAIFSYVFTIEYFRHIVMVCEYMNIAVVLVGILLGVITLGEVCYGIRVCTAPHTDVMYGEYYTNAPEMTGSRHGSSARFVRRSGAGDPLPPPASTPYALSARNNINGSPPSSPSASSVISSALDDDFRSSSSSSEEDGGSYSRARILSGPPPPAPELSVSNRGSSVDRRGRQQRWDSRHGGSREHSSLQDSLYDLSASPYFSMQDDHGLYSDTDGDTDVESNFSGSSQARSMRMREVCCGKQSNAFKGCVCVCVGMTFLLQLMIVTCFFATVLITNETLPQTTGTLSLQGIQEIVYVTREKDSGVVHIRAKTDADAYFAQGVVTAQDRLWQLEYFRRLGQGTLAHVMGPSHVELDRVVRVLGFDEWAQNEVQFLDNQTLSALQSYCDGINRVIDSTPYKSLEFLILNAHPSPTWTPADVLRWDKLLTFNYAGNIHSELRRWDFHANYNRTAERIDELMPQYNYTRFPTIMHGLEGGLPGRKDVAPPVLANLSSFWPQGYRTEQPNVAEVLKPLRDLFWASGQDEAVNSLSWAVRGANLTEDFAMLLVSRSTAFMTPSLWHLVHISSEESGLDVVGAAVAGVPGVHMGRNKKVSWSLSSSNADEQDLYVVDAVNNEVYTHNSSFYYFKQYNETITVKGAPNVNVRWRAVPSYGPAISDIFQDIANASMSRGQGDTPVDEHGFIARVPEASMLALRWTGFDANQTRMSTLLRMQHVSNVDEFREVLRGYRGHVENFMYADVSDTIAYQVAGSVPKRHGKVTGLYPVPGNGSFDWSTRYVDFAQLPYVVNPASGVIVAANNPAVAPAPGPDQQTGRLLTHDWGVESGYRALRLQYALTNLSVIHDRHEMAALLGDRGSLLALDFKPVLMSLDDTALTPAATAARTTLLKHWSYQTETGDTRTTLFERWYSELITLPSAELNLTHWDVPAYVLSVFNRTLVERNGVDTPSDTNCGPRTSTNPDPCKLWATLRFNEAVTEANVAWGDTGADMHQAEFRHLALQENALTECFSRRDVAHGGDMSTVDCGAYEQGQTRNYKQTFGASYRQFVQLRSDAKTTSGFSTTPGQSGNVLSSNYDSMLKLWSVADSVPMSMNFSMAGDVLSLIKPAKIFGA